MLNTFHHAALRVSMMRCLLIGAVIFMPFGSHAAASDAIPYVQPIMDLTVRAIVGSQFESGLFPYGYDFSKGEELEKGRFSSSNLIRQAGTASSLAQYLHTKPDPTVAAAVRKALAFYASKSLPMENPAIFAWLHSTGVLATPFGRRTLQRALSVVGWLYKPSGVGLVISPNDTYGDATAGILSLVLLTEIRYSAATGDQSFATERRRWISALRDLRLNRLGFRGSPESLLDSDYYNGEAWYMFATDARLNPNVPDRDAFLSRLDDDMVARYGNHHSRGFYHWGALAASERYATTRDPRFLGYLKQQTDLYFDHLHQYGRNANLCSEMEGLAATLSVLNAAGEGDTYRASEIRKWLLAETQKFQTMQIQPGQIHLIRADGSELMAPQLPEFVGHFRWGIFSPEFRIDASQHCLSAMLLMQRNLVLEAAK